tara:strand:+ start:94 stop:669 length:576 start_codon:yes stop_codon:yes gene_type:complete
MNKNLKFYIKKFKNVIPDDVCKKTIEELSLENIKFRPRSFYNQSTNTEVFSGEKELDVTNFTPTNSQIYMDKIYENLNKYMKHVNLPYYNSWSGYTSIQWNRFNKNKKISEHCDHVSSMFDGEIKGIPTLSCLGSLNNDYEGGKLFFLGDEPFEFERGDLIIFPSNFLFPHRVEPVTNGVRWSYISWVWGG